MSAGRSAERGAPTSPTSQGRRGARVGQGTPL